MHHAYAQPASTGELKKAHFKDEAEQNFYTETQCCVCSILKAMSG